MDEAHRRSFRVHTYEVDFRGQAQAATLLDYLQEAAAEHAALLGLGVPELRERGRAWLLSRHHAVFHRLPAAGETVEVRTWPSGTQGAFWLRDFEALDGRGEPVLAATTSWIVLDLVTKQMVRSPAEFLDRVLEVRALADDFPRLPTCDAPEREVEERVGFHDIDVNDHVNHVAYLRWGLDAVAEDLLRSRQPCEIEAAYRAEAFLGEAVSARVCRAPGGPADDPGAPLVLLHGIHNQATGQELARLRTRWVPREG